VPAFKAIWQFAPVRVPLVTTAPLTKTSLQGLQLLSSFVPSLMVPVFVAELLSAQTRMDFVPVVFQERDTETDLLAPALKAAVVAGARVTMPPVPLGPAVWKI